MRYTDLLRVRMSPSLLQKIKTFYSKLEKLCHKSKQSRAFSSAHRVHNINILDKCLVIIDMLYRFESLKSPCHLSQTHIDL